jgi:uncharacterized protein involved in exopolysaccharide biosynthesis
MSDEIPVSKIVEVLLRPWKWILAAALLGTVAAYVYAALQPPVYRAEVLITSVKNDGLDTGLGSLAGGGAGAIAGVFGIGNRDNSELVALLKSRGMAERFIASHNLAPILYADRWDAEAGTWRNGRGQHPPTIHQAANTFNKKIKTITENKLNGLVTLSIDWTDPEDAAGWANLFVKEVSEFARSREIEDSSRAITYLESQLNQQTLATTRQAIFGAIESRITRQAMAASRPDFAFRVIDAAVTPDASGKVYPKKLLFAAAGGVAGLLLGGLGALIWMVLQLRLKQGLLAENL